MDDLPEGYTARLAEIARRARAARAACDFHVRVLLRNLGALKYDDLRNRWARDYLTRLSTDDLKYIWDAHDTYEADDPGCYIIENIHAEMNLRGEGCYVAV